MSELSPELQNLYKLARRAKSEGNSVNAQKYYDMISVQNPDDWEAAFYSVYYQAMQTNIGGILNATVRVQNAARSALDLIANSDESDAEKGIHARKVLSSVEHIGNIFSGATYVKSGSGFDELKKEMDERDSAIRLMRYNAILKAGSLFGKEVDLYLRAMFDLCIGINDFANAQKANAFIAKYNPSFGGENKISSKQIANDKAKRKEDKDFKIGCGLIIALIVFIIFLYKLGS